MQPNFDELRPPALTTRRNWRERLHRFQEDPFWRLAILAAELTAVGAALWALFLSLEQNGLAQAALEDQRISSAWQILSVRGSGSTGKQYALGILLNSGAELSGIDLSCGGQIDGAEGASTCLRAPDLHGLQVVPRRGTSDVRTSVVFSSFAGADLSRSDFERADFQGVDFMYTNFMDTSFVDSNLFLVTLSAAGLTGTTFDRTKLNGIDWTNGDLVQTKFVNAEFLGANNISNTRFCRPDTGFGQSCVEGLTPAFFEGAWAWEDWPPLDAQLLDMKVRVRLCPRDASVTDGRNLPYSCMQVPPTDLN